jgi:RNA polymerase sporulation-specific sigma factor
MEIKGFDNYSENEIVLMAQRGNFDAEELMMRRYKDTVRIKAAMYYMTGADEDDVVQEGMIGLMKAIRQFDPEREASFSTFASICITRQIISAIRSAERDKHKALNTSISLNNPMESDNEEVTLADTIIANSGMNPEEMLIYNDIIDYMLHNGDNIFSDFEIQVLDKMIKGDLYTEIAHALDKTPKAIDNAIQRIKKKTRDYLLK